LKAYSLIREQPFYRREAFAAGLRAAGYEVLHRPPERLGPETVLVIWSRYGANHELALRVEQARGRVYVTENGYLGRGGTSPKFDVHPVGPKEFHYYAIGAGFHNDSTRVPSVNDNGERFAALGVDLRPWREAGDHILVCPNRAFGVPGRMMAEGWAASMVERLKRVTKRPIRIRPHPGNNAPKRTLNDDLTGAWAVVVWSSSAGIHALAAGIPVFCDAPHWIMKDAAASGSIDEPVIPERLPAFQRMACGQYTVTEIASGLPFIGLLKNSP
jgi:hypothetical protein